MRYRLHFTDGEGQPRTLSGWKDIRRHPATRVWPDTTTLYFRLLAGHVPDGEDDDAPIVGAGILRLSVDGFARQLTTFRTEGPHGLTALERFVGFFLGELWDIYRPHVGTKAEPPKDSRDKASTG
jgi:cholesterol oxidase